jgi:hypothetical protein
MKEKEMKMGSFTSSMLPRKSLGEKVNKWNGRKQSTEHSSPHNLRRRINEHLQLLTTRGIDIKFSGTQLSSVTSNIMQWKLSWRRGPTNTQNI